MFDGPDGVGKTTQITLAADALKKQGAEIFLTHSHRGTPFGDKLAEVSMMNIDRLPKTDHYVSMAIHSELFQQIASMRSRGIHVLVDRSTLSNWAYQVFGSGLDMEFAKHELDLDYKNFKASLLICYAASLPTLRKRIQSRQDKADYFEKKGDAYFTRVIEGYEFAAKRYGATIINAENSVSDIHRKTMKAITAVID